jgi:hypothetical protein
MPEACDKVDSKREAHMRQTIRAAEKEGFQNIAIVCGAWHAPALANGANVKEDAALLKGLPKLKVESTWVPWTHSRLSYKSGYGAGINSPGWYHHLWTTTDLVVERWMALVARLLREHDLDASSAHVIEACRLAETLAALRGRHLPGLSEIMEATQSVMCFGNDVPLRVIQEKLIVGYQLGNVPSETPSIPLQVDLQKELKRLRMQQSDEIKTLDLDLRKEMDLDRSRLLHRLQLISINWGKPVQTSGKSGTFHEVWQVRWEPDFSLRLIEAGRWGKTVQEAASTYACEFAAGSTELPELTQLLDAVLLADLGQAVQVVMQQVQNVAAVAGDMAHLMEAIPPLVRVARYGNVRKTDVTAVENVLDGLIARVCIGIIGACSAINDEAAGPMFERIGAMHSAIQLLQKDDYLSTWLDALNKLASTPNVNGLCAGRACRLLLEQRTLDAQEAARRFSLALSQGNGPTEAASWVEGFLRGSGLLLIHDETLWTVVDEWLCSLSDDDFTHVLPILRRTFSTFASPERRQMGERVTGGRRLSSRKAVVGVDVSRGDLVLPVVAHILGLEWND